jgi:DNA-directed RNA polymerase subunit M/transcription elongation factor TFIIS
MKLCQTCQNMYVMRLQPNGKLFWRCLSCGVEEEQVGGCLLMETLVKERSSEGYKILLNEFTRQDPTLPHVKNVKCPKEDCASNTGGADRDTIYIKYDPINMKYLYICNVCGEAWRSRT